MKETGLPNPDNNRHRAWEDVTGPQVSASWLLDQYLKQEGIEPPKQARLANPDE